MPKNKKALAFKKPSKPVIESAGSLFTRNPVLAKGLALSPVLAATVALKNGLLLSVVMIAELLLLYFVSALLEGNLRGPFYQSVLFLAAGAFITPLVMISAQLAPEVTSSVGIFLPLLAVNALAFVLSSSPFEQKTRMSKRLAGRLTEGALNGLGFTLTAVAVSVIREIIGGGTLYDRALPGLSAIKFNFVLLPPGALILLGLLAALIQYHSQRSKTGGSGGEDVKS